MGTRSLFGLAQVLLGVQQQEAKNIDSAKFINNSNVNLDRDFFMYENASDISKICTGNKVQIKKLRYMDNKNLSDLIIPIQKDGSNACQKEKNNKREEEEFSCD